MLYPALAGNTVSWPLKDLFLWIQVALQTTDPDLEESGSKQRPKNSRLHLQKRLG